MPHAHHVQPIIGQYFTAGDGRPHAVDQDLRAAAWQTAQPGGFESTEYFMQRELVDFGEVIDLWWAEAVNVHFRKVTLDVTEQLFVPIELEGRMQSALHQDLIAAQRDGLFDLL